jgi:hypothetical protein
VGWKSLKKMSGFIADMYESNPALEARVRALGAEVNNEPVRKATCFRALQLCRPEDAPRGETLVFSDEDTSALLEMLIWTPIEGAPALIDIASCDARVVPKVHPARVVVEIGLGMASACFNAGFTRLISEGFTTAKGLRLLASEKPVGNDVQRPRICRVSTRAPEDEVRAAFEHRGVPGDSILRITADTVGSTGVQTRTKKVHLTPGFPMGQIPWKVALQDPGAALGPIKVAVEGPHCSVCRQQGHKLKKCPAYLGDLCGRCGFPLGAISDENRKAFNHDCEGGPGGYGAEHADPSGLAWHRLFSQHRNSTAAPAEVADPLAEVRASSLASAQAAAQATLARRAAKKAKQSARQEKSGDTPPAKKQQLAGSVPQLNLP